MTRSPERQPAVEGGRRVGVEEVPSSGPPLGEPPAVRRPCLDPRGASPKGGPEDGTSSTPTRPEGIPGGPLRGVPYIRGILYVEAFSTSAVARAPEPSCRSRDRRPGSA